MADRLPSGLFLVSLVLLSACGNAEDEVAQSEARAAPLPPIVVVEEARANVRLRRDIVLPGRVEAVTQAELSFQVDGRLEAIFIAEGERVVAGQEIGRIDDTDFQVELRQARITEETASADLARRRILGADGIVAPAMVEEAEANVAQARARREAAERQVLYTRLTAPYSGVVGRRLVEVGTVISAGQPVVTMVDGEAINVAVDVPAAEALMLPFGPRLAGEGRVVGVANDIAIELSYAEHATVPDDRARTYRLLMRGAPPTDVNLLPGMAVRVTLPSPYPQELSLGEVLVPVSAVLSNPEGASAIFVMDAENRTRRVPVEIDTIRDAHALLRGDGLEGGALVVVAGAEHLADEQLVRPVVRD